MGPKKRPLGEERSQEEDVTLKILMIVNGENKAAQQLITEEGEKLKKKLEDSEGVGSVEIELVNDKKLPAETQTSHLLGLGKSSSAEAPAGSEEKSANIKGSGSYPNDEHSELETTPSVKTPSDSVATELENKTSEPSGEVSALKNAQSELETSPSVRTPSHSDAEAAKKPSGPTREPSLPNNTDSELGKHPSVGTPFNSCDKPVAEVANKVSGTTREASFQNTAHSELEKDPPVNTQSDVEATDIAKTRSLWPSKGRETSRRSSAHSELEQSPSGRTPLGSEAEITKSTSRIKEEMGSSYLQGEKVQESSTLRRKINDENSQIASAYRSIFTAEVPNKSSVEDHAGRVAPTLSSVSSATAEITPGMSIRERFALISPLGPLFDPLKRTTDPFAIPLSPLPTPRSSVAAPLIPPLPNPAPRSSVAAPLIPPRNVMRVGGRGRGWLTGAEENSLSTDFDVEMPKGRSRGVVHRSEKE